MMGKMRNFVRFLRKYALIFLSVFSAVKISAGIAEGTTASKYRLYCMYTPLFENLFNAYFLPSIKDDFEVDARKYPQDCPSGSFHSEGWNKTMLYKLQLLEEAILAHWEDQIFFYSDIDIIFLKPILEISLNHLADNDFVVQQGWPRNGLCAGFFVMKGNEKTLRLIREAYSLLQEGVCIDDQAAIQYALDNFNCGIAWSFLPTEQYPNGRKVLKDMWGQYTPNSEIVVDERMILFHANCCVGIENKYHFLQRIQKNFSSSSVNAYPAED
jgi:hypothetical protein